MDDSFESSLLKASDSELKYLLEKKLTSLRPNKPICEALLSFALLRLELSEMRRFQLESAWKSQQAGTSGLLAAKRSPDFLLAFKNDRAKTALFGFSAVTSEIIKAYGDVDLLLNYLESSREFHELVSLQIQFEKYDKARETLKSSKSQETLNNAMPHAIDLDRKLLTSLIPNAISSSECLTSFYRILLKEKQELNSFGLMTGSLGRFAWRDRLVQNFLISLYAKISDGSATPERLVKALPLPLFDIEQVLLIEEDARSRLQPVFALWRETIESHIADLEYPSETRERLEKAAKLLQRLTAKARDNVNGMQGQNNVVDGSQPFSAVLLQAAAQIDDNRLKPAEKLRLRELLSGHSEDDAKFANAFTEAVDIAAAIKTQLEAHSVGYSILKPGGKCSSCGLKISARSQEVFFACLHSFHLSCFEKEVSTLAESAGRNAASTKAITKSHLDGHDAVPNSECPFCGNILAEYLRATAIALS